MTGVSDHSNFGLPALDSTSRQAAVAATAGLPATAIRAVPLVVASALLLEFIDSTALSTALPTLAVAFHSDSLHLKLALTSYLLALAVFAPASGWAADRFGARRIFMAAMAVFLGGSVLCAMSRSIGALVAARIVQGLGGAMMTPVGRLIVVETSRKSDLVTAMAWFTTPALIGPIIGPPVAGLVLSLASWPWIFLINLPVGLVAMAAVARLVPPIVRPDPGAFDWRGFALVGTGIVALVATAETAGLGLVPVWVEILGGVCAASLLLLYRKYARHSARPVLDLGLLRYQTYRTSLAGGTIIRLGLGAIPFLLPLLLQNGLGWSPPKAGLVMIAMGVGALAARSIVSPLIRRVGFKPVLIGTGLAAAALTAVPGLFRAATPLGLIATILAASGFVRAMQFTATNTIAFAEIPEARMSTASTLATVSQQVGMSLGVTAGAFALAIASSGPPGGGAFPVAFLIVAGISALAAPIYLALPRAAGSEISGRVAAAPVEAVHPHL